MKSKVIVSSLNPAKIKAVEEAFSQAFPTVNFVFEGVSVDSGVPDQPMTCTETNQQSK